MPGERKRGGVGGEQGVVLPGVEVGLVLCLFRDVACFLMCFLIALLYIIYSLLWQKPCASSQRLLCNNHQACNDTGNNESTISIAV